MTSLDTRRAEPADVRGPFHIRRKVVKVCGLRLFASLLRLFGELAEIYPMVPFSTNNNYGFSDYTPPTSGWTPLTSAETHSLPTAATPEQPSAMASARTCDHGVKRYVICRKTNFA